MKKVMHIKGASMLGPKRQKAIVAGKLGLSSFDDDGQRCDFEKYPNTGCPDGSDCIGFNYTCLGGEISAQIK